jgi:hypothetical protein
LFALLSASYGRDALTAVCEPSRLLNNPGGTGVRTLLLAHISCRTVVAMMADAGFLVIDQKEANAAIAPWVGYTERPAWEDWYHVSEEIKRRHPAWYVDRSLTRLIIDWREDDLSKVH